MLTQPATIKLQSNVICTLRLEEIIADVSLLTLGSLGNISLAQDIGKYVGWYVKSRGFSYYIVGPLDTLSIDDEDYFYRVNKSPYITADVYEKFSAGLSIAGIIPVFDGTGKIDANLISSLITRKLTYPVLVEDQGKATLLQNLGYRGTFIVRIGDRFTFLNGLPKMLYWSIKPPEIESLRRSVLLNSIIYISPGEINVRKPFSTSGVVVYSADQFVISEARIALEKKSAPGRIPW
ncbi:hypothetical protein SAMN04488510_10849 [Fervidobacterium changbaicum]|uniref:Uncharacterized protein n=1 Tax=Fervidobacterium islandicum TaxID=2423 RepID=A0AAI8CKX3_FERIS|nr:hypothetical protein [Fervidobacterium islandicum]AMW32327.2 hypothetical protein NA23_02795 [Fervidobacterium islandicum]SDH22332.1 hypothetical protein SAMN04488510_10849 [Fervidobacterium changbaicum]